MLVGFRFLFWRNLVNLGLVRCWSAFVRGIYHWEARVI